MSQKPTESVDLDFETYSSEKQSSMLPVSSGIYVHFLKN